MMRAFSLAEARDWLGARLCGAAVDAAKVRFSDVGTDTRNVQPGQLFVALRGERFDGHRFLAQAQAAGAVAAVVEQDDASVAIPQLVVPDTVQALAQLAAGNRNESAAALVAITGSSGKTTVRQMTGAILSRMGSALSTEGNLNNHIGVPLTLFRLVPEHRFGAIELGASGLGEIAHTVAIVKPMVSVLTNAGQAHLEGFGSYQNIVQAKGEIIDGVQAGGTVVLNRDDPAFDQWRQRAGSKNLISVSRMAHPEADYRAEIVSRSDNGLKLAITGPNGWQCRLHLPMPGDHNASNALMAIAACRVLGATDQQIKDGLSGVQTVKGRLEVNRLSDRLTVIDDSYNANPSSVKAAIDVLAAYGGQRVVVLGGMAELGADGPALHQDVGRHARAAGIERLLAVGHGSQDYAAGFGPGAECFEQHDQAVDAVIEALGQAPLVVLVKGSRSSAMERVVEGIQKKVTNTCCSG